MKKLLFILLFIPFYLNAQTVYWINADGDNSDGLTPVKGWTTFSTAEANASTNDTIVACPNGEVPYNATMTINGVDGSYWIDSTRYTNGWSAAIFDTTIEKVVLDGSGTNLWTNQDSLITAIGFTFIDVNAGSHITQSVPSSITVQQCRFDRLNATFTNHINLFDGNLTVISCQFLWRSGSATAAAACINSNGGDTVSVYNSTFYMRASDIIKMSSAEQFNFKNNIVYNYQNTASFNIMDIASASIGDIDYNTYYDLNQLTNPYRIQSTNYSTFGAYQTAIDGFVGGSEANSQETDPLLQFVATTCVPTNEIVGEDLDYGDEQGYFQKSAISTGTPKGTNLIIIQ